VWNPAPVSRSQTFTRAGFLYRWGTRFAGSPAETWAADHWCPLRPQNSQTVNLQPSVVPVGYFGQLDMTDQARSLTAHGFPIPTGARGNCIDDRLRRPPGPWRSRPVRPLPGHRVPRRTSSRFTWL